MVSDTKVFCRSYEFCQRSKTTTQKLTGLLHPLPVPIKPWNSIGTDFISPFLKSKDFNYLWVVICRMTSMVHLIPIHMQYSVFKLSWRYPQKVVRLHGLPSSIVNDQDTRFTLCWWQELHCILRAKLLMSTSFHPQMDGQTD